MNKMELPPSSTSSQQQIFGEAYTERGFIERLCALMTEQTRRVLDSSAGTRIHPKAAQDGQAIAQGRNIQ